MGAQINYVDEFEGFPGWLVYDGDSCRLAAGGFRVQPALSAETLVTLASRMTLKERLLGINVDGAKCGIRYDPLAVGAEAAIRRFLSFLRPHIYDRLSIGCDTGTRWDRLEHLAALEGILSIKYAVKLAQGLSDDEFFARLRVLEQPVGMLTLAQRRAGHALAMAALAAARGIGLAPPLSCALQGFGNLGRAAACSLAEEGVRITAIADEYGCVADNQGLDVARMLGSDYGTPVPLMAGDAVRVPSSDLFTQDTDMILLAAGENAMTAERAARLRAPLVVVGANCGLSQDAEGYLQQAGVCVIPDFVGGIGGSASMEALFGPARRPSAAAVLDGVTEIMNQMISHLFEAAHRAHRTVRAAADAQAASARVQPTAPPYGLSPYSAAVSRPRHSLTSLR